jgi:O-antigen ligase
MTQAGARGDAIAAGGMLAIAMMLGGGNWLFPLHRLVVELTAVLVLAWFWFRPRHLQHGASAKAAAGLIALAMVLMIAQIVPLPPSIWQGLPGREQQLAAYTALGEPGRWAPISLDPASTRDTIAFFLVPLAMFLATLQIKRDAQRRLLQLIAIFCLLNSFLVVAQFQGLSWLNLYTTYGRPGTGLFANKNHSALFLVTAMPAVAWSIMDQFENVEIAIRRWIAIVAISFLSLTVFGCLSRAGLGLLPIGIAACAIVIAPASLGKRRALLRFGGLVGVLLLLALILPQTAVVSQALSRFDAASDLRYQFWPVVVEGVKVYFPFGSGFGTFQPVFAALEPLSIVKPTYVNHAHSDYLEIALEGGAAGVLLLIGFGAWLVATAIARLRTCRRGHMGFAPIAIAIAGVTEVLLHSVLDYPLRTLALAAVMSVYCAILATRPTVLDLQEPSCYRRGNRRRARTETRRNGPVESQREFR